MCLVHLVGIHTRIASRKKNKHLKHRSLTNQPQKAKHNETKPRTIHTSHARHSEEQYTQHGKRLSFLLRLLRLTSRVPRGSILMVTSFTPCRVDVVEIYN